MPIKYRAYLYRVTLALMPLLVLWGVISESHVPIYAALAAGVFDVGLAVRHTPLELGNDR